MAEEMPEEVVEVIRKVLKNLDEVKDQLPEEVKSAMGILASVIGYGEDLKEHLDEEELRVAMDQLATLESRAQELTAQDKLPADLAQTIKALIKGLIMVLRRAGYDYAYPAYEPATGYYGPTYHYPQYRRRGYYSSEGETREAEREGEEGMIEEFTNGRVVETAELREAVEGTEGLEWDIVLIEAGLSKNRKLYRSGTLKAALTQFEGLSSYADHPTEGDVSANTDRSIRDLAGWVTDVKWDPDVGENGAVRGIYHALASGPIAPTLREAWSRGKRDLVQFSILGEGKQRLSRGDDGHLYYHVESIDRLFSLDAVPRGAAGGRVEALIESEQKGVEELELLEEMTIDELAELRPDLVGEAVSDRDLAPERGDDDDEPADVPRPTGEEGGAIVEEMRRMQEELAIQNRQHMLNERVGNAALPDPVKERIAQDFEGEIFDEAELKDAIEREKEIWSEIMRDKPRVEKVTQTESKQTRFEDALYGMLVGEDVNGVPRFQSLHQAYCRVNDLPFDTRKSVIADGLIQEGIGFDPLKQLRESGSISWTNVFGTAMYRKLVDDYQVPAFDEWRDIVSDVGNLSDFREQKIERIGYYGTLPDVAKGGTYQPLSSPGEEEANYSPNKKGGLEDWTWEDALNDDLGALRKIPRRLALAAKITLYQFVFDFLKNGHSDTTTYDSTALFHSNHGNKDTNSLSSDNLDTSKVKMRSQTALSSSVTYLAIRPQYLIVPNELESLARQLRNSEYEVGASENIANPHQGTFDIVVVDYWSDTNRWFMCANPDLVPTIEVGFLNGREEPELLTMAENAGSAFTADKVVFKVRFVFGGAVADHRGLYASDPDW